MVIGGPREVPRPTFKGPEAPRVFGRRTSQITPFTMKPPRIFRIMSLFWYPGLVHMDFVQPVDCLRSVMVNICLLRDKHWKSLIPIY